MDKEIDERLRRALSGYRRKREQFLAAQKKLRAASATSTSRDRLVTVTVDVRGNVTALRFNSAGYRSMDETDLAELIMDTMIKARAKVRSQARQVVEPLLPAGASFDEIAAGNAPWERLLPSQPVGADQVGAGLALTASQPGASQPGAGHPSPGQGQG